LIEILKALPIRKGFFIPLHLGANKEKLTGQKESAPTWKRFLKHTIE
jgi:hypothetical protein